MPPKYIWLDGKIIFYKKAGVPLLTHGFHYGDSAFEGIRFYKTEKGPAIFRLDDHLKRLSRSMLLMTGQKIPFSESEIKKAIVQLIKKNKIKNGYIRPLAFLGERIGLKIQGLKIHLLIIAMPWGKYFQKKSISVKITKLKRLHPETFLPEAKISGYYINSLLANQEAARAGFDEALLLDCDNNVAEGSAENIFMVKNKKLYTPKEGCILPGITRDTIIKIAEELKLKVYKKDIDPAFLLSADEVFFTGTAAEITPITKINNKKIKGGKIGPITKLLQRQYADITLGKNTKWKKWLTFA